VSEHEQTQPPPPEPAPPRRLFRSREDRVLGGVAGGLGRYFGIDPIIFRIAFVALTFVSGIGLILYLGALLFVPVEGEAEAPRRRVLTWIGVGVLAVLALWLFAETFFWFGGGGPGFFPPVPLLLCVLLGAAVYWAARRRGDGTQRDTGRRLAIAAAVVLTAPLVVVASFWAAAAGGGTVIAGLVIAAGALLIIGAFRGGLRWLVVPALLIALPVGIVAAADIELDGEYGEHELAPASLAQLPSGYQFAAGRLELDLRGVEFPESQRTLDIEMGMGEAVLIVPDDVCVLTRARIGAGYLRLHDRHAAGFDVESGDVVTFNAPQALVVNADIGLGALQIVNDPDEADWESDERDWERRFGDHDHDDDVAASDACRAAA
jgi:phage shock protein PspC (stress-responsive transcriptional regulator)